MTFNRFNRNVTVPVARTTFASTAVVSKLSSARCINRDLHNNIHALRVKTSGRPIISFQPAVSMRTFRNHNNLLSLPFARNIRQGISLTLRLIDNIMKNASVASGRGKAGVVNRDSSPFNSDRRAKGERNYLIPSVAFNGERPSAQVSTGVDRCRRMSTLHSSRIAQ